MRKDFQFSNGNYGLVAMRSSSLLTEVKTSHARFRVFNSESTLLVKTVIVAVGFSVG